MDTTAAPVGQTAPDRIRAILSDAKPQSSATATQVDGSLHLYTMDSVMADIVAQAAAARGAFTLVMARPGPGVTPGEPIPTSTPAEVEDLAAALAVSVTDNQPLLRAGTQHLAVVVPGGARAGRREAMDVMRSAAAQGAPLFTWASAHYPSEASTAGGLVDVASSRLDGPAATARDAALAADEDTGRRRTIAAVWAGVAAAILAGIFAFALHGGPPTTKGAGAVATTGGSGGPASTSSSGGTPSGSAGGTSGASAGSGSAGSTGYNYTGGGGSSSGGSGSLPPGSTGSSSGTSGGGGSVTQQGTSGQSGNTGTTGTTGDTGTSGTTPTTVAGGSTATTLPGGITLPTLPLPTVPTTTIPVGGTGTTGNNCTGLLQSVTCTIGGLLKGL